MLFYAFGVEFNRIYGLAVMGRVGLGRVEPCYWLSPVQDTRIGVLYSALQCTTLRPSNVTRHYPSSRHDALVYCVLHATRSSLVDESVVVLYGTKRADGLLW